MSPQTQARLSGRRRVDPEAYEAYLKGRYAWNRRTEDSLRRSAEFFHRAIERDPGYALAYAGLADAYNILGFYSYLPAEEAFPRAKAAALKALEMDETLGEAHAALGYALHYHDWKWTEAERELRRAIELNPSYAVAHQFLGNHLSCLGRLDDALAEALKARELDPLSMLHNTLVGWFHIFRRDYDRAVTELHRTRELDPSFMLGRLICGWAHAQKGEFGQALTEFEQAALHGGDATVVLAFTGHALAVSGDAPAARGILERLLQRSTTAHVPGFFVALLLTGLGETPAALDWLEKAYEERSHWLTFLGQDPRLDPLRGEPRYEALRRRVGV